MPPRYAYWTILIDDKPTAFRAREREELLPTFHQLQRKNTDVKMQWFARGHLWASREAERDDFQLRKHAAAAPRDRRADRPESAERRGSDWRPGGTHKDPRDRFKKKNRPERAWSEKDPATQRDRDKLGPPRADRPWSNQPAARPRARKPWRDKPAGGAPPSDRPWQTKPTGPRAQRKPWSNKPAGDAPHRDRPWSHKPSNAAPGGDRPWRDKPPRAAPRGDRPWSAKPPAGGGGKRPWSGKPRDQNRKPFTPRGPHSGGTPVDGAPRKRRDEDPDQN